MAGKRLNKKVAIIGLIVFILVGLAGIFIFLKLSQDPQKFIEDGDAYLKNARNITDPEVKEQEYEKAAQSYLKARARSKSDSSRVDILFKLVDLYLDIDKWPNIRGCWGAILQLDSANPIARFGQLKYIYIVADNGAPGAWKEVLSQADDFLEVADEKLLRSDPAELESFAVQKRSCGKTIEAYLHFLKARALFESAKFGNVTSPEDTLADAENSFKKVIELEPNNIDAYWYLAQTTITKGRILGSRGDQLAQKMSNEDAIKYLQQCVDNSPDNPRANVNLLAINLSVKFDGIDDANDLKSFEPQYIKLVQKFDDDAYAYSAISSFYQLMGYKYLDQMIGHMDKACQLDPENVTYVVGTAGLYHKRFSLFGSQKDFDRAIELASNALLLPNAQDVEGPRYWANKANKASINIFLANAYINRVLDLKEQNDSDEVLKDQYLAKAADAVHNIEQLIGSGEDPKVVLWRGMLDLAKGNRKEAIEKLYSTYNKYKAAGRRDSMLSYTLAKLFENSNETGAAAEFFGSALSIADRTLQDKIDQTRPEALLEYGQILLWLDLPNAALAISEYFQEQYWSNLKSQTLRINGYIAMRQFDQAQELLDKLEADELTLTELKLQLLQSRIDEGRIALLQRKMQQDANQPTDSADISEASLQNYQKTFAQLVEKQFDLDPNSVKSIHLTSVLNYYINQDEIQKGKTLVNKLLAVFPDNSLMQFYKKILDEPQSKTISVERKLQIEEQTYSEVEDPIQRSISMGAFYARNNDPNKAYEMFSDAFKAIKQKPDGDKDQDDLSESKRVVTSYMFDIAVERQDWAQAQNIVDFAKENNLDDSEGAFFQARLELAKGNNKQALLMIDKCLKNRPVFSFGYMIRSDINAALGNEDACINDAKTAQSFNPLDGNIAKALAKALYQRNNKLGENVTSEQLIETKDALIKAIRLNPNEWELQSFYAEYISDEDSERALAIRQSLQKNIPNLKNAYLLAQMATRLAEKEKNEQRKLALFNIADSSFQQARAIDPNNKSVVSAYAEYYRITGQEQKAEALIKETKSDNMLWRHYIQIGKIEQAKNVLDRMYLDDQKDVTVIQGLLRCSRITGDLEGIKKFSDKLVETQDNAENRLLQTEIFLQAGLTQEAEYKLQSLKEKYPKETKILLLEAWLAKRQGKLQDALRLINRGLETNQDNAIAWRLKGEIDILSANYSQAISDLSKSKSILDDPLTRLTLAKAYIRAQRDQDAISELKNIIDQPSVSQESRLILEQLYTKLGRNRDLKTFYEETLAKYPGNVFWCSNAATFSSRMKDYAGAEILYKKAWDNCNKDIRTDIGVFEGYLNSLLQANKLNDLFDFAAKYLDSDFAPVAYINMAKAKIILENKTEAMEMCHKAIEKSGENENFVSIILKEMYQMFGEQEVTKICQQRLTQAPNSIAANITMFNLAKINGQYNKAIEYIDKCLSQADPNSDASVGWIIEKAQLLQSAYNKTSDNQYRVKAITEYESLLDKMPNNTSVLNNLAYMLAEKSERLDDAVKYAQKANEIETGNPGFLDTYAYALYKNQQYEDAAEQLHAALENFEILNITVPWDVYEHLGQIKEKLGNKIEAFEAYKQALDRLENSESDNKKIKERLDESMKRLSNI